MSLLPKQKCFDCDVNGRLESENRSLRVEIDQLKQNQAKLIEAVTLFTEYKKVYGDKSYYPIPHVKINIACEILKEVSGEEKK